MYLLAIICSAVLDIFANLLLKKSNAFSDKKSGILAIILAVAAFYTLSISVHFVPLSVAYSTWGVLGILGTCAGGYVLYGERLNKVGILGVGVVITAVILLNY